MTPKIMEFLKETHNITKFDRFNVIEITGFMFITLHRGNGITEVIRYVTSDKHPDHFIPLNPRKISFELTDEIVKKLLHADLPISTITRLMAVSEVYVEGLKAIGNTIQTSVIVTQVDLDFSMRSNYTLSFTEGYNKSFPKEIPIEITSLPESSSLTTEGKSNTIVIPGFDFDFDGATTGKGAIIDEETNTLIYVKDILGGLDLKVLGEAFSFKMEDIVDINYAFGLLCINISRPGDTTPVIFRFTFGLDGFSDPWVFDPTTLSIEARDRLIRNLNKFVTLDYREISRKTGIDVDVIVEVLKPKHKE